MLFAVAEYFGLSADLVRPGQGLKRRRAREAEAEAQEDLAAPAAKKRAPAKKAAPKVAPKIAPKASPKASPKAAPKKTVNGKGKIKHEGKPKIATVSYVDRQS